MTNELSTIDTAYGASHASISSYITGFLFSIILTIIPFLIASLHLLAGSDLLYTITLFALLQFVVQLVFFLHLNTHSKAKWNLIAMVFTVLMVTFLVIGTIWIMQNLSNNMMSPVRLNNMANINHGD